MSSGPVDARPRRVLRESQLTVALGIVSSEERVTGNGEGRQSYHHHCDYNTVPSPPRLSLSNSGGSSNNNNNTPSSPCSSTASSNNSSLASLYFRRSILPPRSGSSGGSNDVRTVRSERTSDAAFDYALYDDDDGNIDHDSGSPVYGSLEMTTTQASSSSSPPPPPPPPRPKPRRRGLSSSSRRTGSSGRPRRDAWRPRRTEETLLDNDALPRPDADDRRRHDDVRQFNGEHARCRDDKNEDAPRSDNKQPRSTDDGDRPRDESYETDHRDQERNVSTDAVKASIFSSQRIARIAFTDDHSIGTATTTVTNEDGLWTPPDSSYGTACPVCGCIPKSFRKFIELFLIATLVVSLVAFLIHLSLAMGGSGVDKYHRQNNDDYLRMDDNDVLNYGDDLSSSASGNSNDGGSDQYDDFYRNDSA